MKDPAIIDKEFIKNVETANEVYGAVVARLNIDRSDKELVEEIFDALKWQTRAFMVNTVWKYLTEEQSKTLQKNFKEVFEAHPSASTEDTLLEFAQDIPDLMEKIHEGLDAFFEEFIVRFNAYLEV